MAAGHHISTWKSVMFIVYRWNMRLKTLTDQVRGVRKHLSSLPGFCPGGVDLRLRVVRPEVQRISLAGRDPLNDASEWWADPMVEKTDDCA
jgi:hypothetical protein